MYFDWKLEMFEKYDYVRDTLVFIIKVWKYYIFKIDKKFKFIILDKYEVINFITPHTNEFL